jgi:aldose sugar dehydrogenase
VPAPAPAPLPSLPTSPLYTGADGNNTTARAVQVATGLTTPWSAAWLPNGRVLITQRTLGSFALLNPLNGQIDATIGTGLPVGGTAGHGGLLDVALDPAFATNGLLYWTYTEDGGDGSTGTNVARGRLVGNQLQGVTVLHRQSPKVWTNRQYGARLVFGNDGHLFVTIGDNGQDNPDAPTGQWSQNPATSIGKVLRIDTNGSPAAGNPSFGTGAVTGLWSIGHRNPQGAAIHPATGELFVSEHGPLGGDEINVVRGGNNHGWPYVSYGCNYGPNWGEGCRVGGGRHAPTYAEPITTWVPQSIATSGIAFNAFGTRYPGWENNLFVGAMSTIPNGGLSVWRLTLSGYTVVAREYLLRSLNERIRDVRQAPDGYLYLLTDSGRLLRLEQR